MICKLGSKVRKEADDIVMSYIKVLDSLIEEINIEKRLLKKKLLNSNNIKEVELIDREANNYILLASEFAMLKNRFRETREKALF